MNTVTMHCGATLTAKSIPAHWKPGTPLMVSDSDTPSIQHPKFKDGRFAECRFNCPCKKPSKRRYWRCFHEGDCPPEARNLRHRHCVTCAIASIQREEVKP